MLASEFIRELHDLVDAHGDRTLILAADDEGNEYHQAYSPQTGIVHKEDEHGWSIDSVVASQDVQEEYLYYREGCESYGEAAMPYDGWFAKNYAQVFVV